MMSDLGPEGESWFRDNPAVALGQHGGISWQWRVPRPWEPYGDLGAASEACGICGHAEPHHPHPEGEGWPMTVLRCASCPEGKCVLPEAAGASVGVEQLPLDRARNPS